MSNDQLAYHRHAINAAPGLDALLECLRAAESALAEEQMDMIDLTELPTYGGEEPARTDGVWSWDAHRMLVGTCISDMEIVGRTNA